jgi:hypothetical protein
MSTALFQYFTQMGDLTDQNTWFFLMPLALREWWLIVGDMTQKPSMTAAHRSFSCHVCVTSMSQALFKLLPKQPRRGRNHFIEGGEMPAYDSINEDRMDMLKWVSERNQHVPLSELSYMLGLGEEGAPGTAITEDPDAGLYDICIE